MVKIETATIAEKNLQQSLRGSKIQVKLPWQNQEEAEQSKKKRQLKLQLQLKDAKEKLGLVEKALIGACAGGIAGAFTYVCLHPLDTVKTKLQTKGASQVYKGASDVVVKVLRDQGLSGFYKGVSAVLVGSAISSAIYFGTCEFSKAFLSSSIGTSTSLSLCIPPLAGACGNIVSSAVMVPKELITQRMQAGAPGRSWQVLLRTVEEEGFLGLYAGYSATIMRNLPAGVLSFSSFEYLKATVLSKSNKPNLQPHESVCCGALAGGISAFLTTPLDVAKTRLMTQGLGLQGKAVASYTYKGLSSTLKQILVEEGLIGLTRGMGPRMLHSSCFAALGYFAFETARINLLRMYIDRKMPESASNHVPENPVNNDFANSLKEKEE